jgi:V8-like Glu-specific endopeptidase
MENVMKQSLRLLAALVLAASAHVTGQVRPIAPPLAAPVPETTVFSPSLRFEGKVVEQLANGRSVREVAYLRGRKFVWQGQIANRLATPERLVDDGGLAPAVEQMTRDELAKELRGVALFNGHQFQEAEPAYDLADEVIRLRELELKDPLAARASLGKSPAQGNATYTRELEAEGPLQRQSPVAAGRAGGTLRGTGPVSQIVHGSDNRGVMDNTIYPHRTQIVFDNTGSTSTINGAEGSGTLIGPSTAMSVAHVFWDETADTWESDHRWAPGYDSLDANPSPYGEWYRCYWVTIPTAYTNGNSSAHDYAVLDFDVGCNSVRDGVNSDQPGSTVGWLGFYTASSSDIESHTGYVRGYPGLGTCGNPGVSCNIRVWGDTSSASENNATSNMIEHQADTSGGQSGSGFYHYADPSCSGCGYGPYPVGMHRAGSTNYNLARRFDSTVYAFLQAYSSDY